MSVGSSRNEWL